MAEKLKKMELLIGIYATAGLTLHTSVEYSNYSKLRKALVENSVGNKKNENREYSSFSGVIQSSEYIESPLKNVKSIAYESKVIGNNSKTEWKMSYVAKCYLPQTVHYTCDLFERKGLANNVFMVNEQGEMVHIENMEDVEIHYPDHYWWNQFKIDEYQQKLDIYSPISRYNSFDMTEDILEPNRKCTLIGNIRKCTVTGRNLAIKTNPQKRLVLHGCEPATLLKKSKNKVWMYGTLTACSAIWSIYRARGL